MNPEQHSPEHTVGGVPTVSESANPQLESNGEWSNGRDAESNVAHEQAERQMSHRVEADKAPASMPSASAATTLPSPVLPANDLADAGSSVTPLAASDDDLIEKEWVAAIKKVLQTTREDPYKREQAIKSVQVDYIMKRYAKKIGETDD